MDGAGFAERLLAPRPLLLDAACGTALIAQGLDARRDSTAAWALSHPEALLALHGAHAAAGAEALLTATFGASAPSPDEAAAALRLARAAAPGRFISASLWAGLPRDALARAVRSLALADAIWLETATSAEQAWEALETARAALETAAAAAVVVTLSFTGFRHPRAEEALLGLAARGAAAVGFNCGPWPAAPGALASLARSLSRALPIPLVLKPDAGALSSAAWAAEVAAAAFAGARLVGGCCGTGAAHLAALRGLLSPDLLSPR